MSRLYSQIYELQIDEELMGPVCAFSIDQVRTRSFATPMLS